VNRPISHLFYDTVGSTNRLGGALLEGGVGGPLCLVARRQTAGFGQAGRAWSSETGGLSMSLLVAADPSAAPLPLLALATAYAVCQTVRDLGVGPRIKWPNDVYAGDRKLAGVLVQAVTHGARARLVIGIGLNVNQRAFEVGIADKAVSLSQLTGRTFDIDVLSCLIGRAVQAALPQATALLGPIADACQTLGRRVRIETQDGSLTGVALGLAPSGGLLLKSDAHVKEILHGSVYAAD
jgi:BirA family biotin operon repressor/biotin-[acetyl-CoA-carboxylase] ligase